MFEKKVIKKHQSIDFKCVCLVLSASSFFCGVKIYMGYHHFGNALLHASPTQLWQ